jgi:hypothetical protein
VIADWSLFGCSDYIDKPTAIEPIRLPVEFHRLCTCWLAKGMNPITNFLKPRLAQSHTTVVIPLYKRVVFVRLLNCSEFSSRLPKISQALNAITGIQFRVGSRGLTAIDGRKECLGIEFAECFGRYHGCYDLPSFLNVQKATFYEGCMNAEEGEKSVNFADKTCDPLEIMISFLVSKVNSSEPAVTSSCLCK